MRVGIYVEPSGTSIGGAEAAAAMLAAELAPVHEVDIVHHRQSLTAARLAGFSGTDLSRVRLRHIAPEDRPSDNSHSPWRRYHHPRTRGATLSGPYDLFVTLTHGVPPFCHARRGLLIVLFPWEEHVYIKLRNEVRSLPGPLLWNHLKRFYHQWEWARRFDSYQQKTAISRFSQAWTKRRWGIDCQVVYPPVDTDFSVADKTNTILSVGRFTTAGHSKKQLIMVTAFQEMTKAQAHGWEYFCVGALSELPADQAYFESVRRGGMTRPTHVLANIERGYLKRLYEEASVFWHAAGHGEDDDIHPELAEHFGLATVEAMAAGCVPVVVDKGGQSEIVEHGVSGFLWRTMDELKHYTMLLVLDEQLRKRMAEAALVRARFFSRGQFVHRFRELLRPLLS